MIDLRISLAFSTISCLHNDGICLTRFNLIKKKNQKWNTNPLNRQGLLAFRLNKQICTTSLIYVRTHVVYKYNFCASLIPY